MPAKKTIQLSTFGLVIDKLRTSRGMSKKDLYSTAEISPITLYRYEVGERLPDTTSLLKFADIFDVSIDYLLGRTSKPDINK